jgi:MFS family permease
MLTVSGTGSQILIQNAVEGAMRGRVMSIYGLTWRAAPGLGALTMGALSAPFGLQAPLAAGAVLCLLVWLVILPKRKTLVNELEAQATRAARGHGAVERKAAE